MTTKTNNPFDILPANLFNVLGTQGRGGLQRHYMAILLRIYELAEFNRFALTREMVVAEIVEVEVVEPPEGVEAGDPGAAALLPVAVGGDRHGSGGGVAQGDESRQQAEEVAERAGEEHERFHRLAALLALH